MDREELLRREEASWGAFRAAVLGLPEGRRTELGVVPGWSVHNLVWHCGFWADDAAARLEALAGGGEPQPERPEPVWQAMNDRAAEESKEMSWEQVLEGAEAARRRVRAAISALPEGDASAEADFAEETFEHYDEHAAEVQRFAGGVPSD